MSETAIQSYRSSFLTPSLDHATVGDAMHPGILSCHTETPLAEVARMMTAHRVHCIAVMTISHGLSGDPMVYGIISDLDVIRAGIRVGSDETAGALAQQPVITVKPSTPLRQAGELMLTHGSDHLVVCDPETHIPIGILSTYDLISVLAWSAS
jgi:CBS domain-containing protein